jgi:AraC-like DNA-binding protein
MNYKNKTSSKKINNLLELDFKCRFEKGIEKYIYDTEASIELIAKEMTMSISTLERWVKKIYACTPKKYIIEKKLEKAHNLLHSQDYKVNNVAQLVGFNSTSYFCLCYKRKYENSPRVHSTRARFYYKST